jgi:hypothetical protein
MIDKSKQKLIDHVIGQIELDLENRDVTAIIELLDNLPAFILESFLSESEVE